jgi:hypothetical protein
MMKFAEPQFCSWIDVQLAVLHPRKVYSAENLTEHCETSCRTSSEPHVMTLSRVNYDSAVEIVYYRETVSLRCIVIHYVDDNVLAL